MSIQRAGNPIACPVNVHNLPCLCQPIGRQQEDIRSEAVLRSGIEIFPFPWIFRVIHVVMRLQHFKQMHLQQRFRITETYSHTVNFAV